MGMAQVAEHGPLVVGHTVSEIGIIEALIARGFRHVLQDAKLLLQHLLAIPGHLAPLGKHIVLDVVALARSEFSPSLLILAQAIALLRVHVIPLIELLTNAVLFVEGKALEGAAALQHTLALRGRQVAHGVDPRPRSTNAELLPLIQIANVAIGPIVIARLRSNVRLCAVVRVRRMILVGRRTIGIVRRSIRMRLCWVGLRLGRMRLWLRLRRTIRVGLLRPSIAGSGKTDRRQKCYSELESRAHLFASI